MAVSSLMIVSADSSFPFFLFLVNCFSPELSSEGTAASSGLESFSGLFNAANIVSGAMAGSADGTTVSDSFLALLLESVTESVLVQRG